MSTGKKKQDSYWSRIKKPAVYCNQYIGAYLLCDCRNSWKLKLLQQSALCPISTISKFHWRLLYFKRYVRLPISPCYKTVKPLASTPVFLRNLVSQRNEGTDDDRSYLQNSKLSGSLTEANTAFTTHSEPQRWAFCSRRSWVWWIETLW